MKPLISIIIPVYNPGIHFKKCLSSILLQRDQSFETIIIDDGSTDGSLELAKQQLANRAFTKIITQKNSGVSAARNKGLEFASCEYITFIDSDDFVEPDYIEQLNKLVVLGADIILTGKKFICHQEITKSIDLPNDSWTSNDIKITKYGYLDYATSPVANLYKKATIEANDIKFNIEMSYAEDREFNIDFILCATNGITSAYNGYRYVSDIENSLSKRYHNYMFKNDILYWDKLYSLFSPIPENATQVKSYLVNRLFNFIADNISSISHIHSLTNCLSIVNDIEKNINTDFFRTNFKHINSTFWQRFLIFISPKLYCTVIYLLQKK